jgi:hypothetical protein
MTWQPYRKTKKKNMSEKIIKITIDPKGQAKIEAEGFHGSGCKDATKMYESLYDSVISAQDKPELYEGAGCPVEQIRV